MHDIQGRIQDLVLGGGDEIHRQGDLRVLLLLSHMFMERQSN